MSIQPAQPFAEEDAAWFDDQEESEHSPMEHVHEPLVGMLAAEALIQTIEQTLQMVNEHFRINNVTAAVGAIAASECNILMAREYLSRAQELVEDGANPEGTEAVPELAELLRQYEKGITEHVATAAKRGRYQNFHEDTAPWYCHRFQMTCSLTGVRFLLSRMAALPDDTDDLDRKRHAHLLAAFDVSTTPTAVPQHPDPQAALRQPDGYTHQKEKIERQAQSATAEMHELTAKAQREFAQSIPTVTSPAMSAVPDMREQLATEPLGVNECRLGFTTAGDQHEGESLVIEIDDLDLDSLKAAIVSQVPLHYVAFIHDARCHVMAIGEPYPPGFPAERVMQHMELARQHLDATAHAMSQELYLHYEKTIDGAESAADVDLHCLTPQAVNSFLEQAKKIGMPRGVCRLLMEGMSHDDPYLAERLLGHETEHHWYDRMCSRRAGRKIIETARQAGMDEYALAQLAETLGFDSQQLGVRNHPLGRRKLRDLQQAAKDAGIDESAWERMEGNLLQPVDK